MARYIILMMAISLLLIVISFVKILFDDNARAYSFFYFTFALGTCLLAVSIILGLFFLI